MHAEAWSFLDDFTRRFQDKPITVLEFGSRDVNGSPRQLPGLNAVSRYVGVDIEPGPGVDVVGDAADVDLRCIDGIDVYDLVICAEVFEHTPVWRDIVRNAYDHLRPGGLFLCTAASDPRAAHSAVDGNLLEKWSTAPTPNPWTPASTEYYDNVSPADLSLTLDREPFREILVTTHPRGDVYGRGVR